MSGEVHSDEGLVSRWPLPLAQLYRRAQNAKTPLERHLSGFYIWEASLKLLASVAVVNYARREQHDPALTDCLRHLVRPSLGNWWETLRRLTPVLADDRTPGFPQIRDFLLGPRRDDLPRLAGLDAALTKALEGKEGARATVCLNELIDRLVNYRNREIGHGAAGQRGDAFYEEMGRVFQSAASELLSRCDVLAGRRLLYIGDVRQVEGQWLIQRFELHGENARRIESLEWSRSEVARLPDGERVYLSSNTTSDGRPQWESLYPFLIYDLESNQAAFLNSRRGQRAKGRGKTAFLCYTTGQEKELADSGAEQRELLALVLEMGVSAKQTEQSDDETTPDDASPGELPATEPRKIGEYELLSELGRGGMGVVYRAWQPSLGRYVALKKVLKVGDLQTETRFRREIRALGQVEHPHLVKIFTSGSDGDQWFYVMELVEGAPLDAVSDQLKAKSSSASEVDLPAWRAAVETACDTVKRSEKTLSDARTPVAAKSPALANSNDAPEVAPRGDRGCVQRIVELICQVAGAAHALHEHGILHRDIKPGNIQVTAGGSQAVLMDLGLAQLADDVEGRLTRTRQFVGTLRYASPQQVLAVGTLDRRSDVYSLGATLWEMLTLRPLFGATEQMPTPELMEKIQREEPERLRKYHPGIPADIEAIVHKCLEKDPKRRYATALELSDDLQRFLVGEPVQARPIRAWEQTLKWARRRPLAAALWIVGLLAVASAAAGGLWFMRAHEMQGLRDVAEQERDEARRQSLIADQQRTEADRQRDEANRQRDEADKQRAIAEKERSKADVQQLIAQQQRDLAARYQYGADMSLAQRAWQDHQYTRVLQLLDRYRSPKKGEPDYRSFEWRYLSRLSGSGLLTLERQPGLVYSMEFSPNGRLVTTAGKGGVVTLWDAVSGERVRTIQADQNRVTGVAFSPDGNLLATGGTEKQVKLWNVADGSLAFALDGHTDQVVRVAFSPDGRLLASGSFDHSIKVWDVAKRKEVRALDGSSDMVASVAFSPDSKQLVSGGADNKVRLWNVETGKEILTLTEHTAAVNGVVFSPDGKRLASASEDSTTIVSDATTGRQIYSLDNGSGGNFGVAFSPDGTELASTGDGTVTLWNMATGIQNLTSRLHSGYVWCVKFSPDGTRLASGSIDGGARVSSVTAPPEALSQKVTNDTLQTVAFAPDRSELAWGGQASGDVALWDLNAEHAPFVLKGHKARVMRVVYSPDGGRLATGEGLADGNGGTVKVWEPVSHKEICSFSPIPGTTIRSLSFSPDGRRLAAAAAPDDRTAPGEIRVWDVDSGNEVARWHEPSGTVWGVAFSPDGKHLATCGLHGSVAVRDAVSGTVLQRIAGHFSDVYRVVYSPDGRRIATCGVDGTARVWDAETLRVVFELQAHSNSVTWVEFSSDGQRIGTASLDRSVKIWDATTGQEILTLSEPRTFSCVTFRPDGKQVVACGSGGVICVWEGEGTGLDLKQWRLWLNRGAVYSSMRQWAKAVADYDQAFALNPNYSEIRSKRGVAEAELGRWEKAVVDFAKAISLGERNVTTLDNLAGAQLAVGDTEGYRATCAATLTEFGDTKNPSDANSVAWTCVIVPGAVADMSRPLALAERAVAANAKSWAVMGTLGSVLYRAGRFQDAIERTNQAIEIHDRKDTAWDDLFEAMAHKRLGHEDEAKKWLDKARRLLDANNPRHTEIVGDKSPVISWDERLELKLLREEAEALVKAR